ncbi:N-acetylglucosamine-6-phosphate deacetylase [Neobacillus terrae]|uniref:N-acetylglucosamine-6-phosphate deacetylase n=1 Tax=Neobacillus terrae TaxID=3034837 RepID=UPI00140DDDEE|nr:N-acetylglucosamine-6-phosphate deacetylase [Neobacillus terrae]
MGTLLLVHGKALVEKEIKTEVYIYLEKEKILEIGPIEDAELRFPEVEKISIQKGHTVVPGFIDLHIHGAAGADTMDATPEALKTIAEALAKEGTTSFLATTITQEKMNIEKALENAGNYIQENNLTGRAEVLGIHLEGPFINEKRAGAQPREYILKPNLDLFRHWQELAGGNIKQVTIAPELENGLKLIGYFKQNGVIASIGHTDAVYEEMEAAVNAGARQVTHLFNGMRGMHHREPGTAGTALLFKELMIEVIADGIHVHPKMVKLALSAKGADGTLLITDSMRAKCLKNGVYDLGGQDVHVADGKALLEDGTLAGSILKMNEAVKNIAKFTEMTLTEAVQLASTNPARQLGVLDRKGSIAAGKDADITVLNDQFEVELTLCRGEIAFKKEEKAG